MKGNALVLNMVLDIQREQTGPIQTEVLTVVFEASGTARTEIEALWANIPKEKNRLNSLLLAGTQSEEELEQVGRKFVQDVQRDLGVAGCAFIADRIGRIRLHAINL